MKTPPGICNVLSVDVEEYFHPTEIQPVAPCGRWPSLPSRVESQTYRILDLFSAHGVQATFFVLGWVAERHPQLVQRIAAAGHEIGCHSFAHQLVYSLTPAEFRDDLRMAISAIENACGSTPRSYRAPSYSITGESLWALDILAEQGFTHDSSIYPIRHDRYGIPGFGRHAQVIQTAAGPIREIPIATVKLPRGRIAPVGGGGYLRLLPYRYTAAGLRRINQAEGKPACVYFHPWEIDPRQPRLASGLVARMRTYTGLAGMFGKLDRLLSEFRFGPLSAIHGNEAMECSADPVRLLNSAQANTV